MQSSWPRRFVDAETAAELGLRRGAGGLFDERRLDGAEGKRGQGADGDSSSVLDSHELRRATREMEAQDSSWVSDMNATWADPCMPPPGRPGWYPSAPAAAAAHLALRPRRRRMRGAAAAAHARGAGFGFWVFKFLGVEPGVLVRVWGGARGRTCARSMSRRASA